MIPDRVVKIKIGMLWVFQLSIDQPHRLHQDIDDAREPIATSR